MQTESLPNRYNDSNATPGRRTLMVIVPAYNEAERIAETINALRQGAGPELDQLGFDLIIHVIDDGSQDDTGRIARKAGADRVLRHKLNQGLGAAVRTGLMSGRDLGVDILVKFDADLQHDPQDIKNLIQPILDDEAEVVYGNRFERIEYRMPFIRRTGNIVFTRLMRWLTGWPLKDSQPGIFAVDRTYLKVFQLPGDYNYTQQVLIDAYCKSMRFAHVSVAFRKRITGKSFITLKYPLKVLPQILLVLVSVRPMRVFVPMGLIFMAAGTLVFGLELLQWLLVGAPKPVQSVNFVMGTVLFGLQTLFFGLLAQLIVQTRKP